MQNDREKYREIASRIYDLDGEVYECVGSSLGRAFTGEREATIRALSMLMYTKPDGHLLRNELALISNMARTIEDKVERKRLMIEYDKILKEISALPNVFGKVDILDKDRIQLNPVQKNPKMSSQDHLVICISRTQGSAGNDIGFALADQMKINYYDAEIFQQVLQRLEAEKDGVQDAESFTEFDRYSKPPRISLKERLRQFNRYHGLSKQDAVFFNMSDLICNLARTEDCIIMGRCADVILMNNFIPHISLFISAPFEMRLEYIMGTRNMNLKDATRFLKRMDRQHRKYYEFYANDVWGKPENYDLCINSANYGMQETIDIIKRLLDQQRQ